MLNRYVGNGWHLLWGAIDRRDTELTGMQIRRIERFGDEIWMLSATENIIYRMSISQSLTEDRFVFIGEVNAPEDLTLLAATKTEVVMGSASGDLYMTGQRSLCPLPKIDMIPKSLVEVEDDILVTAENILGSNGVVQAAARVFRIHSEPLADCRKN